MQGMPISELQQVRQTFERGLARWPRSATLLELPQTRQVRFLQRPEARKPVPPGHEKTTAEQMEVHGLLAASVRHVRGKTSSTI